MFKFNSAKYLIIVGILMDLWWAVNETGVFWFTGRHFWNRKKTWWQQEFAELPKISLHMSCHMK